MFPFEKLTVYTKAKAFHREVQQWLKGKPDLDRVVANQLKRAALSVPLNIAEGSGRFTNPDRRNFYVIARASVFECVAIFDILRDEERMDLADFEAFYGSSDELSRMLFVMVRGLG